VRPVFGHGRLRLYLLKLLEESPRHGYEVIRLLEERFLGLYAPSAGTVYPRLAHLEAEGLVTREEEPDGRKVYRLTDAGRTELHGRAEDLADLEEEISGSVRELAEGVRSEVRGSTKALRDELRAAARDVRRDQRHDVRQAHQHAREGTQHTQRHARRSGQHGTELDDALDAFASDVRRLVASATERDAGGVAPLLAQVLGDARDRLHAGLHPPQEPGNG
jgi:DNA-binding PadR family transcriptional regulator